MELYEKPRPGRVVTEAPHTSEAGSAFPARVALYEKYTIRNVRELDPLEQEEWWHGLDECGTLRAVFPDVPPGGLGLHFWRQFIDHKDHDIAMVYEIPARPGDNGIPVATAESPATTRRAMFWLTGKCGLSAFLNFGFLKAGLADKIEIGRYVLWLLWSEALGYKSLASLTPDYNLPAIAYAEALGGRIMGRWPGACLQAGSGRFRDGVLIQFLPEGE